MDIDDHLLNQRLAGLRLAAIFLGVIATLSLIRCILVPVYQMQFLNQLDTLVNLFMAIYIGSVYFFSNKRNYEYFAWSTVIVPFIFFLIQRNFGDLNEKYLIETAGSAGFPGMAVTFAFLLPTFLVLISAMFLRPSFVLISSIFYFCAIASEVYLSVMDPRTYLSNNMEIVSQDRFAINEVFLIFNSQIYIFTCIACFCLVLLLSKLTQDVSKIEKTNFQLGRYFSPEIRKEIENLDLDISVKPQNTQMVAILFTDIIGFTKIAEKLEPSEVLELLSEYQTKMIEPIFKNLGTVDKFIGDAVMATFGTPMSRGNDAQNAFSCARDMQIAMRAWEKQRSERGETVLKHRIGIHYGRCVVGNVGSKDRMEFAVIGDTVNVASRICDACKDQNAQILISDFLKNQLNEEIETALIKNYKIRGREETMDLHKIVL